MARKARHRISYVLPIANSCVGHRLGVNGLAVDNYESILYSGGRDGVICAWNLGQSHQETNARIPGAPETNNRLKAQSDSRPSLWRTQVQAHTHWINDVAFIEEKSVLVSASSDLTVKVWRPYAEDNAFPQTLGLHSDYVKRVASSRTYPEWVASGGLDHKVCLWDLNGAGQMLQIDVSGEEKTVKGSVYALGVGGGILASGGPECIVRVWDPRSGQLITKFVGHTDNIRDVLISEHGDIVVTASSDQTVKVWSLNAGRCMHTLTMHNDSVWSIYSDHARLSVLYSSDRSGLVAKTSALGTPEMDQGVCVAVCKEHQGVNKVVSNGVDIWTATSSSSINRWADVDVASKIMASYSTEENRPSMSLSHPRSASLPLSAEFPPHPRQSGVRATSSCFLQLSNAAVFPTLHKTAVDTSSVTPVRNLPRESIEGQNGLIKHVLLNDRRRVLTLDTVGEVVLWDLVKCERVRSYGKRHLDEVVPEVNTIESVANWCTVDTRTGLLACVLEENYCFDGEVYADELEISETFGFREDQRINLGKWLLRYLFSALIDEEIRRDEGYRKSIIEGQHSDTTWQRGKPPTSIQIPQSLFAGWRGVSSADQSGTTPRAVEGFNPVPQTPGMSIGAATPTIPPFSASQLGSHFFPPDQDLYGLEKRSSQQSQSRASSDKTTDYFSRHTEASALNGDARTPSGPGESYDDTPSLDGDKESRGKDGGLRFGKKFRMPFAGKKLGKPPSVDTSKQSVVDEKSEASEGSISSESREQNMEENLLGVVQKIRLGYHNQLRDNPEKPIASGITPSLPSDTPVLKPPPLTAIIIQEDRPDSGGVADLYRGTVASAGRDVDLIERMAPVWLGDVLLRNQLPPKEVVKISFVLQPYQDLLPSIATIDGNHRLNANRMLRAKKILAYVAERMEFKSEEPESPELRPEDYLELYCQDQLIAPTVTLGTLRTHIWKGGADVMLYYKSNGRRTIVGEKALTEMKQP